VALHAGKLWPFLQEIYRLELDAFGTELSKFKSEIKGSHLLDKDRFKWSEQDRRMDNDERRKHCTAFLTKGREKKAPTRKEFTAYGQACLEMARGIFQILNNYQAVLFASAIPRGVPKPGTYKAENYLRKDQVFLFERFFYFLESKQEHGLIVMDEVEKMDDRRFVKRLEDYFKKTDTGRNRTRWIVPTPFFVSSDMTYPIQVADVCIYCINWGFRLPALGMDSERREEIANLSGYWLGQLQFNEEILKGGESINMFGIVYVPDPYTSR
jgi:hypothetical protein